MAVNVVRGEPSTLITGTDKHSVLVLLHTDVPVKRISKSELVRMQYKPS
jgi:hypothetical protein